MKVVGVFGICIALALVSLPSRGEAESPTQKAADHFERGVQAFSLNHFAEAKEEFEEAYRLVPNFQVLFNLGQINVAMGHHAEAVDAFERYLAGGGTAIPAKRRQSVLLDIESETLRIASRAVRTSPVGAEIRIDGRNVGQTPMEHPVRVDAGLHSFAVTLEGYEPEVREWKAVGGTFDVVEVALKSTDRPRRRDWPSMSDTEVPRDDSQTLKKRGASSEAREASMSASGSVPGFDLWKTLLAASGGIGSALVGYFLWRRQQQHGHEQVFFQQRQEAYRDIWEKLQAIEARSIVGGMEADLTVMARDISELIMKKEIFLDLEDRDAAKEYLGMLVPGILAGTPSSANGLTVEELKARSLPLRESLRRKTAEKVIGRRRT